MFLSLKTLYRKRTVIWPFTLHNYTDFIKICELTEIDCLVTDTRPDEKFCEQLAQAGVTLIVADE